MNGNNPQPDLQESVIAFRDQFNTVILSTADINGSPNASYAPHWINEAGEIYIFVSQLATHTQNLLRNAQVSLLFIQDEEDSRNRFARQRLTLKCGVEAVQREDSRWTETLDRMQRKHGSMMELLRSLPDFQLFCFHVESGDYVAGFGKAYRVSGNQLLVDPEPRRA